MMERIVLALVCLSGCHISCLQYHYVAEPKTWTEAQTYCRQTYTDLATLGNADHVNQLLDTVTSAGYHSKVWIGLYTEINWKWSDGFNGSGADYRNWETWENQPDFYTGQNEFCIEMRSNRGWNDQICDVQLPFMCYTGSQENPQFVFVEERKTWFEAQRHCRENYIDLATVRNQTEDKKVKDFMTNEFGWIGLYRDPNEYWSDGSSFMYKYRDNNLQNPINSAKVLCGVSSVNRSGKWRFFSCDTRFPFVCYSLPKPVKKQLVKLRMTLKDSSVDLNDPAVRAQLLEQLQDRLKRNNVTGVTLKWNQGPDGKVFHKEEEGSQETEREKDEL